MYAKQTTQDHVNRSTAILIAFLLVGAIVGGAAQSGYHDQTVSQAVSEGAQALGIGDAFYLAEHFGYLTNDEAQYILGLYQVRNCALISFILTPAAGAACSAGTLT